MDGVPSVDYMPWSLIDDFDCLSGYLPKSGLALVDRQTFARTLKSGAAAYCRVVRQDAI